MGAELVIGASFIGIFFAIVIGFYYLILFLIGMWVLRKIIEFISFF